MNIKILNYEGLTNNNSKYILLSCIISLNLLIVDFLQKNKLIMWLKYFNINTFLIKLSYWL